MSSFIEEIQNYFGRVPRFNVVLIRAIEEVQERELIEAFNCDVVNIQNLVIEGDLNIEGIDGYTGLLTLIGNLAGKAQKNIILILHLDILLTSLNKQKRQYFFEALLQKTFTKPVILITHLYADEVPDTSSQEYNYAKTIQWR